MQAIVQDRYGSPDGLRLREIDRPAVGDDEVLVRVRAASVHPDVWHVVSGRPFVLRLMGSGLRRPKCPVPGTDLAGVVEAVGKNVTRFQPGDEVFGESLRGFSWRNGGAFAEYASVPEEVLALKPSNVTFEQAAAVPTTGYITLLNVPRDSAATVANGSWSTGPPVAWAPSTVQLAKAHGAHVTGVDHTRKLELVRSLGADEVLDYTRDDFTRSGQRYDLIVDIPGNHPFAACRRALTPDGNYVLIGHDHFGRTVGAGWGACPGSRGWPCGRCSCVTCAAPVRPPEQEGGDRDAPGVSRAGQLTPVIDRTFPLGEAGRGHPVPRGGRAESGESSSPWTSRRAGSRRPLARGDIHAACRTSRSGVDKYRWLTFNVGNATLRERSYELC